LLDNGTPQGEAFAWLLEDEFIGDFHLYETLQQRYALATLYFSMLGDSWINNGNWLSSTDECSWNLVVCNGDSKVTDLDLSKYERFLSSCFFKCFE